jgi:hypothetical protein
MPRYRHGDVGVKKVLNSSHAVLSNCPTIDSTEVAFAGDLPRREVTTEYDDDQCQAERVTEKGSKITLKG